jgi:hypothetical protein
MSVSAALGNPKIAMSVDKVPMAPSCEHLLPRLALSSPEGRGEHQTKAEALDWGWFFARSPPQSPEGNRQSWVPKLPEQTCLHLLTGAGGIVRLPKEKQDVLAPRIDPSLEPRSGPKP